MAAIITKHNRGVSNYGSGNGKGDKDRPVDPKKWEDGWKHIKRSNTTEGFKRVGAGVLRKKYGP